jgi:6-phosphogluconolactonase
MGKAELITFKDDNALAQNVADRWLSLPQLGSSVAFSGGRIAVKFFQALAAHPKADLLRRPEMKYFFADERCVPPDHPDSNFRLMKEHLLDPVRIPPAQVHRIPGELAPDAAADKAAQDLLANCQRDSDGVPILDMVFLGMGEDGHVASIFPGDPAIDSLEIYRPVVAAKPPPHRITIGLHVITRARHVWVLVSGDGKENALRESLDPLGRTPLARVIHGRSETAVFTDLPTEKIK